MVDLSLKNVKRWSQGLVRAVNYRLRGRLFTPPPKYICFRVTKNCNAECIMCSDWKNREKGEITVDEVRAFFSNPLLKEVRWVNVLGGEPTIRKELPEMIQAIYERVPLRGVGINTNGFVTDSVEGKVSQILEKSKANPLTRDRHLSVVISVDGVGALHDQIRGYPNGFAKICKTLDRLQALKEADPRLHVSLTCCVQPQNVHGVAELQQFGKERGLPVSFFPIRFAHVFGNQHDKGNLIFKFTPSQEAMFQRFMQSTEAYQSSEDFRWAWDEHFAIDRGQKRELPCLWFYGGIMLFPDGNITLCDSNPEQVVGNIRKTPIDRILRSSRAVEVRDELNRSICSSCSFTTSDPSINLDDEFWYRAKQGLKRRFGRRAGTRWLGNLIGFSSWSSLAFIF